MPRVEGHSADHYFSAESIGEFLRALKAPFFPTQWRTFYRGHSDLSFDIWPSVFRDEALRANENYLIRDLISSFPDEFRNDSTTLEQLVRAQHHGLATRILDVTLNPLIALCFACSERIEEDGCVGVFKISDRRSKIYDSDTVSCIANLCHLTVDEKDSLALFMKANEQKISNIDRDDFNKRPEVQRLVQFIRGEKPYFLNEVNPLSLSQLVSVIPKQNNRRIAQSGAFIIFGLIVKTLRETTSRSVKVYNIVIPAERKRK